MVEPEVSEPQAFDEDLECSKSIFVDRFKKVVTNNGTATYRVFSAADEKRLKKELKEKLSKNRLSIEETI